MKDAVYNVGHVSLLVAALSTGRYDMIQHAMKDALHQPYRASLIPGMSDILERAVEHGALGVALSGAGPTLLALVDAASLSAAGKAELTRFLRDTLQREGIEAATLWLKPCLSGAEVLTHFDPKCTLIQNIKGEVRA
jgi:homoserine kinase